MRKRGVRRAPRSFAGLALFSIIAMLILALAGCSAGAGGGGNGNSVSVTITNKVASVQAGTGAISFSATVQNDSGNSGVTWSLTANGASCSPSCGALSAATTTSVTYTPPASAGASPNNQPTVTATSVAKTSKSDSDTFTVSPALGVTIANKFTTVNTGSSAFVVNATVQNDSTNSGVGWTLTTNGAACSAACGTLTGATTASITYAPPSTVPTPPNITLTATSVHETSKSDSDSFTIQQPAISVVIQGKVASVVAGSGTIFFDTNVQNDPLNGGITWTLAANGTNCTASTCGTLSPAGQGSINFNPPATAPASPFNKPTLKATSMDDPTKSDSDTFTITNAPPISVTVSRITSILAGSGGINFSANVQNDYSNQGGTEGVTWTLTAGGTACSPTCGSLSGTLSGSTNVTYTPPATAPSGSNDRPTVTATSIADNTKSGSDTFTISSSVANSCGAAGGSESLLNGHYAFLAEGFSGGGAGTPIFAAASLTANGSGGFTGGVNGVAQDIGEGDFNDSISPQHVTFTSSGSLYTVGSDHRGCLQLTNSGGTTAVFHFALGGINSGVASKGRIIEFDDNSGNGTGSRGSGILRLQDPNAFTLSALQPQYAFGVSGWEFSDGQFLRLGAAGTFKGDLSNGTDDIDEGGLIFPETSGITGGSINPISPTTGRTSGSFDIFTWAIYVVNSSEFLMISTDSASNGTVEAGRAIATASAFTASALSGNYIVHTSGNSSSAASVDLELLTMTPGGGQAGTLSGTVYSDGGGNGAATTSLSNVAYNIDPALGRVALGNPSDNLPVLYVTTPTDGISAFVVGVNADAEEGVIEFQPSQTYSTASVAGTYFFGTEDPGDNSINDEVGATTVTNSGSASGTVDTSGASALQPGVPFNATVTISNSNGTGNLGSQTVAITNGTKIFYIDESAGVIVVAEQ
jgi:hypothetical protein